MPAMANISALDAAAATVVFDALVPSSGDKASAIWRPESIGSSSALRPRFEMKSQANGTKTARRVEHVLVVPFVQTDTASGLSMVAATIPFRGEATFPAIVDDSVIDDAIAYYQSLIGSTLFRDALRAGFAPT